MIFLFAYAIAVLQFPGLWSLRVVGNLLTDNSFIGIAAVGMTFVIIAGSIDLSVGSIVALSAMAAASTSDQLGILAIFNVRTIWELQDRDPDALKVEVYGQQWWWEYRYDTNDDGKPDIITANQMVIPAGRQINLIIRSNDVIHSFWIPALNGKKDAVPGHIDKWLLEASKPGLYQGQCTEFCGLSHGKMKMEVKALSASDFDAWVANQQKGSVAPAAGSVAEAGQKLVQARCLGCHQINGFNDKGESTGSTLPDPDYRGAQHPLTAGNAPNLTHLMSRNKFAGNLFDLYTEDGQVNTSNLGNWLRNPKNLKPMAPDENRGMPNLNLSQDQIDNLVAFLSTLK